MELQEGFFEDEPLKILADGEDTGIEVREEQDGQWTVWKSGALLARRPDRRSAIAAAAALVPHAREMDAALPEACA